VPIHPAKHAQSLRFGTANSLHQAVKSALQGHFATKCQKTAISSIATSAIASRMSFFAVVQIEVFALVVTYLEPDDDSRNHWHPR
jgi:hypothetical protein